MSRLTLPLRTKKIPRLFCGETPNATICNRGPHRTKNAAQSKCELRRLRLVLPLPMPLPPTPPTLPHHPSCTVHAPVDRGAAQTQLHAHCCTSARAQRVFQQDTVPSTTAQVSKRRRKRRRKRLSAPVPGHITSNSSTNKKYGSLYFAVSTLTWPANTHDRIRKPRTWRKRSIARMRP